MAIAFDNSAEIASGSGSFTVGTGSNRILFVGIVGDLTDTNTGCTYNGVAMTLIAKDVGSGDRWTYLFYLINPTSGANTLTSSGNSFSRLFGASYTGAKQSGQPDNSTHSNVGAVASITETLTPVAANCWAVIFGTQSNGTPSAGTGTTARTFSNDGFIGDTNGTISGSTSMTVTRSASAGSMSAEMASFSPALTTVNSGFLMFM